MLMSHHDVVAADGEWLHPPFAGEIADGKIWGRGTVDTKTSLFSEFQAFEELLNEGWEPPYDDFLGSSYNEELGGDGIPLAVSYFSSKGINFDIVLDEGGAVLSAPMPGISCKCAMIGVHEKGRCMLNCVAKDGPSHVGLSANKETPIVRMAKFITEISKNPPFIKRLYPEVRSMFEYLAPYMILPMRVIFSNLWIFGSLIVKLMPALNPQAGAMIGTQCFFQEIHSETNSSEKSCKAEAFFRGIDKNDLMNDIEGFKKIADKYGIEVSQGDINEIQNPSDINQNGFKYMKKCVESVFPHAACAPFLLPAGTDSRHFTAICPCVLRFAPIEISSEQFASVHSLNENIDIETIPQAVNFYKEFLRNLSTLHQ